MQFPTPLPALVLCASVGVSLGDNASAISEDKDPLPAGAKVRLGRKVFGRPAITPDGKHFVEVTATGLVRTEVATGKSAGNLGKVVPGSKGFGLVFSADATRAAAALRPDGPGTAVQVIVWDIPTGRVLAQTEHVPAPGMFDPVFRISLSADGRTLLVAHGKRGIPLPPRRPVVWDVDRNQKVAELRAAPGAVYVYGAMAADGATFAAWAPHRPESADRLIQFWTRSGEEISRFAVGESWPEQVAISPTSGIAAVMGKGLSLQLVDVKTGRPIRRLFGRVERWKEVTFSPDGAIVMALGDDGNCQAWDSKTGNPLYSTDPPVPPLSDRAFSGLMVFSANRGVVWSRSLAWEVPSGRPVSPDFGHTEEITSLAFTDGGRELLTAGADGRLLRWNPSSGQLLGEHRLRRPRSFPYPESRLGGVIVSSDGLSALGRGVSGYNSVFSLDSGCELVSLAAGFSNSFRMHPVPDVRTVLAVPSVDGAASRAVKGQVWDVLRGLRLAEVDLPDPNVLHVAISPDRSRFATLVGTAEYTTVVGWDLTNGKKFGEITSTEWRRRSAIEFAPDNNHLIVSRGFDGNNYGVLDLAAGKEVKSFFAHPAFSASRPVFSSDGKVFAIAANDLVPAKSSIHLYTWPECGRFHGFPTIDGAECTCLSFGPHGKSIVAGYTDGTALVWEVPSRTGQSK